MGEVVNEISCNGYSFSFVEARCLIAAVDGLPFEEPGHVRACESLRIKGLLARPQWEPTPFGRLMVETGLRVALRGAAEAWPFLEGEQVRLAMYAGRFSAGLWRLEIVGRHSEWNEIRSEWGDTPEEAMAALIKKEDT